MSRISLTRGWWARHAGKPSVQIRCPSVWLWPGVRKNCAAANAAFWVGLALGGVARHADIGERMDFNDAKENFLAAARRGLKAGFTWIDGVSISASELILEVRLPVADQGLLEAGIGSAERDLYLGVIEARVRSAMTGADCTARSLARMGQSSTGAQRMAALTAAADQGGTVPVKAIMNPEPLTVTPKPALSMRLSS